MVDLADQGETSTGQALGDVELPQRPAAVQRRGRHLADDGVELAAPTGCGYLHPVQMVVQVDIAVLQPHRMVQPPGDVNELVAQRFQQMQTPAKMAAEVVEAEVSVVARRSDD